MGYWDETDQIERSGRTPMCCGQKMYAQDDHGRFACAKCGKGTDAVTGFPLRSPMPIPQVSMARTSNEQKAEVPLVQQLHEIQQLDMPAEAKELLANLVRSTDSVYDPRYAQAIKAFRRAGKK